MLKHRSKHADLIEAALKKKNMEQQELADAIQITPASISKWLTHHRPDPVSPLLWKAVCAALDIPLEKWIRVAKEERPKDVQKFQRLVRLLSR